MAFADFVVERRILIRDPDAPAQVFVDYVKTNGLPDVSRWDQLEQHLQAEGVPERIIAAAEYFLGSLSERAGMNPILFG